MAEDPLSDFLSREQEHMNELGDDFVSGQNQDQEEQNHEQNNEFVEEDWNGIGGGDQQPPAEENGPQDTYSAIRSADTEQGEPEKIRQWRIEFEAKIAEKDEAEAKAINEWRESAKHELETWAKNHEEQMAKNKTGNRETQEAFIRERDESLPGGEWERVARLCDFNPKTGKQTKDVSRMRSILFRLKTEPLVR
ncbi:hypothetical protein BOX15_Mlig005152g2 [Macrostomum lignano]|uniref:Clathrin light chain n=1 Tax=Macrostomum lignano TaxID=282301 RepID=A0A267GCW1_9PLAT|nr:hypothetical protein BOX15_Mlig005152g2 [Macrostomum lignano]